MNTQAGALVAIGEILNGPSAETANSGLNQADPDSIKRNLQALGLTVSEVEEEPQESNSKISKEQAANILPMIRVWLNATVFRDGYQAGLALVAAIKQKRQPQIFAKHIDLDWLAREMNRPEVRKVWMQKALNVFGVKEDERAKILDGFAKTIGFEIDKWTLVRAINSAARRSNYGNFKGDRGFIYVVESDHRVTQIMGLGQYRYTEPCKLTVRLLPAATEEDYLKPYRLVDVPNPDNPEETVRVRVYKYTGNAFKVSSSVSTDELDYQERITGRISQCAPGEAVEKQYDRDLTHSEFDKLANSDLIMVQREAEDLNIKIWPMIDIENRRMVIYHAGELHRTENELHPELPPFAVENRSHFDTGETGSALVNDKHS